MWLRILSVMPVNYSCSWRQHLCYMYLLDGTEIKSACSFLGVVIQQQREDV